MTGPLPYRVRVVIWPWTWALRITLAENAIKELERNLMSQQDDINALTEELRADDAKLQAGLARIVARIDELENAHPTWDLTDLRAEVTAISTDTAAVDAEVPETPTP